MALASPIAAEQRVTLGWGRLFTNDALGDGRDRWRTGSYTVSRIKGISWSGELPTTPGEIVEFRFRADTIAPASLTDPDKGNPIHRRFCDELCERAIELSCREDVRAVLVTAEGRNFGFGGDIAHFVAQGDALPSEIKRMTATIHSAIARLQRMDAPMVVAVQGICAGGSAAFAAGCDTVVSADNARWVAAYTGIGYSTDASATVMFSRRMGLARARNFLLRNQTLDAQAALAAGLVLPALAWAGYQPGGDRKSTRLNSSH